MDTGYFLQGDRSFLRAYEVGDALAVARWYNNAAVTHFMFTGQQPLTPEAAKEKIESEVKDSGNVVLIACDKKTKKAIGLVGLYGIHPASRRAEMRILIGERAFHGKGYGTELSELINFYGFDRLNLNRIYLGYTADNKGAGRAYEKAGYREEGVLKQDMYRNSVYYDTVRMAILRDDYYKKYYSGHKKRFSE